MVRVFVLAILFSLPLLADEPSPVEVERQQQYVKAYQEGEEIGPPDFSTELWSVVTTLIFIIALLIGGTWLMKRFMTGKMLQMNQTSSIKIVDQRNLSTKTAIYIIEIYDKHIVVGETAGNVTALAEFPIEEDRPPFDKLMEKQ